MSPISRVAHRVLWLLFAVTLGAACRAQIELPVPAAELNRRLLDAVRANDLSAVRAVVDLSGSADLIATSEAPRAATPLRAAIEGGHVDVVRLLVSRGANVNRRPGGWGETPLMLAARHGDAEIVEVLLDGGANPFAEPGPFQLAPPIGTMGGSAMDDAVMYGHEEVTRRLLLHGVKPDQSHVYLAITNGRPNLLWLVIAGGGDSTSPFPWNGRTPLQEARLLTPGAERDAILELLAPARRRGPAGK